MNELKVFENKEFGTVRTMELDNKPWFVGKDIADILGYDNPSKALADHVDEEDKLNNKSLSSLGQRGGWIINESGLYSLILSSKLPKAKQFKRWVTSEVLPAIREHGAYVPKGELRTYLYKGQKVVTLPDFIRQNSNNQKEQESVKSRYWYYRKKNRFLTEHNCIAISGRDFLSFQIENDIWLRGVSRITLLAADAIEFLSNRLQYRSNNEPAQIAGNTFPEQAKPAIGVQKAIDAIQKAIAELQKQIETLKQY